MAGRSCWELAFYLPGLLRSARTLLTLCVRVSDDPVFVCVRGGAA